MGTGLIGVKAYRLFTELQRDGKWGKECKFPQGGLYFCTGGGVGKSENHPS